MSSRIRLALAQINSTVGDLDGNCDKILSLISEAEKAGADLVLFPELAVTGYPPEDLLLKTKFIEDNQSYLKKIAQKVHSVPTVMGFVDGQDPIFNAATILHHGHSVAVYHKICLPNYSVFDEMRYFRPGKRPLIFEYLGIKIGLNICEDIWIPDGVTETQALRGDAEIILNISASPYYVDKREERIAIGISRARRSRAIIVYLNTIGGQDELIFDGNSFIVDHHGKILAEGQQFEEDFIVADLDVAKLRAFRQQDPAFALDKNEFKPPYDLDFVSLAGAAAQANKPAIASRTFQPLERWEEIYRALVLGTQDYVRKNGFQKVVIGLSGGIDSALTAVIAVDALGPENVIGVIMPSEVTAPASVTDAEKLAHNLGIQTETVAIKSTFESYLATLQDIFEDRPIDVTEENIQARIRGNILMALSNKFGWLVLTTGNKSENSVGYCTLYGDMAGGFAVIKDVPKTWVYQLCETRNARADREIIPESIMTKAPTAELKRDQKDQDTLPPYDLLDPILEEFIENDKSVKEIIALGYPREVVKKVARMVDNSEYKRRQAPPGIKITHKAFGKDRRVPITNRYKT